ncbi:uncharacterized protein [Typha angustifolia]|uniref:uncharacterized protein n=1 Tax=Typha angustifolia TaxID=59011 RepID=UPI003C2BCDC7
MDEAEEILLNSLRSSGVSLPTSISSLRDLSPDSLFSICAQFLHLIDPSSSFPPPSLPETTAERFEICERIASAVWSLGYGADLSFHQFLYPSNEDSYKVVRFLVEKLAESSEVRSATDSKATGYTINENKVTGVRYHQTAQESKDKVTGGDKQKDANKTSFFVVSKRGSSEPAETTVESVANDKLIDDGACPWQSGDSAEDAPLRSGHTEFGEIQGQCSKEVVKDVSEEPVEYCDGENIATKGSNDVTGLEEQLASLQLYLSKLMSEADTLKSQEKCLVESKNEKSLEAQNLEGEYNILNAAVDMAFDDQHSLDFHIRELNEKVEDRKQTLMELKSQRNALKQAMEERKMSIEQSPDSQGPDFQEGSVNLKKIEQEIEATLSEFRKREVEYSELLVELENLPKISPRKSYVQRITEITKNIWKQDADIERIVRDTRELQIESNSIRERLHRTYAVVEETVFRDAKTDPVRRQIYRLLTSIHDGFEQISENILATDRARREAAEFETKLAAISSRSFDIEKLQTDLDSIRRENEALEQHLNVTES